MLVSACVFHPPVRILFSTWNGSGVYSKRVLASCGDTLHLLEVFDASSNTSALATSLTQNDESQRQAADQSQLGKPE